MKSNVWRCRYCGAEHRMLAPDYRRTSGAMGPIDPRVGPGCNVCHSPLTGEPRERGEE